MSTTSAQRAISAGRGRDRYLDVLRALALIRIVTYHAFAWHWLTWAFPSLGIMFALAGSLMAGSLRRRSALGVVRGRVRRVLLPFWLFGAFVVVAMVLHGWGPDSPSDQAGWWASRLASWVFPLTDPPFISWAWQVNAPVWYIRAYLWFVLLSPLLLWIFRRIPWPSVAGLLILVGALQAGLLALGDGPLGPILTDFAIFGPCWLLGFAHHDGQLRRLRPATVIAVAAVTLGIGAWYALNLGSSQSYDLGEMPFAQAWWSFGFVLLVLRFQPHSMNWLARIRLLEAAVTLINARAVTIYLWHEVALLASVRVIDWMWSVPLFAQTLPLHTDWWKYLLTWPLLAVAVLLFGWVEDVAARRPVRLWPAGAATRPPNLR